MITEYQILVVDGPLSLVDLVNNHIKEGWQPFGRPYIAIENDKEYHYQAMVKYESKTK